MRADEYEQKHMELDGPVRFRDRQRSRLTLVGALGVAALVVAMISFGLAWPVVLFMACFGAVGAAVDFAMASYRVVLTDRTLHLQHGFRTERVPLAAIERARVAPLARREALFGHGIHRHSLDGSIQTLRASGLRETVRIEWRAFGRRRTTVVATDRAEELVQAIEAARGERRVRVEVEPDVIAEEIEACLRDGAAPRATR